MERRGRRTEALDLKARIRLIDTVPGALMLWAAHERLGGYGSWNPASLENAAGDFGSTIERQVATYVRGVSFYDRAYPVLWWEWVKRRELRDFSAREYCALMHRDLVRDESAARDRLGWMLPHRDGRRLWTPFEIVTLFENRLGKQMTEVPLRVLEPAPPTCPADIAEKVEEVARRKWGRPKSLRDL